MVRIGKEGCLTHAWFYSGGKHLCSTRDQNGAKVKNRNSHWEGVGKNKSKLQYKNCKPKGLDIVGLARKHVFYHNCSVSPYL